MVAQNFIHMTQPIRADDCTTRVVPSEQMDVVSVVPIEIAAVAGAFTDSYAQGAGKKRRTIEQEPLPFRFVVDLVTIDGEWLVDDFTPVGGAQQEAQPEAQPGTGGGTEQGGDR